MSDTPDAPKTVTVSRGQFIAEFTDLVSSVRNRNRQIPWGTAFQIAAFGYQAFDAKVDAAARARLTEATDLTDQLTEETAE